MSRKVLLKLHDTEKVLKRTIKDATEVTVPTTFIILPQKITSEGKNDIVINGNEKDVDKIATFIETLTNAWKNVTALIGNYDVYMYLIDEYTRKPVIPDKMDKIYPITINVNTDGSFLKSISPYLAIGFKFVSIANSIAGMPSNSSIEAFIQSFVDDNSVEKYSNLSKKASTVTSKDQSGNTIVPNIQNTRGATLRELKKFFKKNDPDSTFCQLRRVVARTGYCLWTTEENFQKMESDEDDDDNLFAEIVKNKNDTNDNAGTEIDQQSSLSSTSNHNTSTSTEEEAKMDQHPLSAITPMLLSSTNNNNTDNTSTSTEEVEAKIDQHPLSTITPMLLSSTNNNNTDNTSTSTEEEAKMDQHSLSAITPMLLSSTNNNNTDNTSTSTEEVEAKIDQHSLSTITPMLLSSTNNNNTDNTSTSTEEVEAVNCNYNNFCCSSCRNICCTCYG